MGASVEAVEAAGEATRASPALGETAAKAAPDSAPGPETARVDDAAPSLLGDSSSDAASARSPAPVSASRASSTPPASPSRHAPDSVQELLGLRRLVDGGTPLTSAQARRAESLVKEAVGDGFASGNEYDASRLRLTSSELASLGLSAPSKPELPSNFDRMPLPRRLSAAQAFIDALTYNHVGGEGAGAGSTFFSIDKRRPVGRNSSGKRNVLSIRDVGEAGGLPDVPPGWPGGPRLGAQHRMIIQIILIIVQSSYLLFTPGTMVIG